VLDQQNKIFVQAPIDNQKFISRLTDPESIVGQPEMVQAAGH